MTPIIKLIGQLTYRITPDVRMSLYGGWSFGRSSESFIRFDDTLFGLTIDATINAVLSLGGGWSVPWGMNGIWLSYHPRFQFHAPTLHNGQISNRASCRSAVCPPSLPWAAVRPIPSLQISRAKSFVGDPGILVVTTEPAFPPFVYLNSDKPVDWL